MHFSRAVSSCASAAIATSLLSPLAAQDIKLPETVADVRGVAARQARAGRLLVGRGYAMSYQGDGDDRVMTNESFMSFKRELRMAGRTHVHYEHIVSGTPERRFREEVAEGFDGVMSWRDRRSSMILDREKLPRPMLDGTVDFSRGLSPYTLVCTGWFATLPGWGEPNRQSVLELLDRPFAGLEVRAEGSSLVLSLAGATLEEWWLRADWAYCLHLYRISKNGVVQRSIEIEEAVRLHEDLFYPTRITNWSAGVAGNPATALRQHIELSDLELTTEAAADDFKPSFRPGTVVTVCDTGQQHRIGHDDEALRALIFDQAAAMKAQVEFGEGMRSRWLWWAGCGLLLGGVVLLLGRWLTTRTRRRSTWKSTSAPTVPGWLLVATMGTGLATSVPAQDSWWFERAGLGTSDNCGVNAVLLACRFFNQQLGPQDIASRLACDPLRVEPVSLDTMQRALIDSGCRAEGYRSASLEDVIATCRSQKAIAIVHTVNAVGGGHYYVVGPARAGIFVANPAMTAFTAEFDDVRVRILASAASGVVLLVREGLESPGWRIGDDVSHQVSVGSMPEGAIELSVPLLFDQPGKVSRLASFTAACGCVRKVELVEGALRVGIDGSRAGASTEQSIDLQVQLESKLVARRLVVVFRARDDRALRARPCVILRSAEAADDLASFRAAADVVVPDGGRVKEWSSDHGVVAVESTLAMVPGGIAVRFDLQWTRPSARMDFVVADASGMETKLPLQLPASILRSR